MTRPTRLDQVRAQREQAAVDQLADAMVQILDGNPDRSLIMRTEDVADVDLWRKAARRAGRRLGWKTRTGVSSSGRVWMVDDRATDELPLPLRVSDERQMQEAARRMGEILAPPNF